jgi:DNA-binding transcriptional ArsR family regulator
MSAETNPLPGNESMEEVDADSVSRVLKVIRGLGSKTGAASLDRLIHERMRLAIVSALAVNESLTFNELKEILQTTDGNLSVHARRLEEADYLKCIKYFDGRIPRTEYRLTDTGRQALERYLGHMEALVQAMQSR